MNHNGLKYIIWSERGYRNWWDVQGLKKSVGKNVSLSLSSLESMPRLDIKMESELAWRGDQADNLIYCWISVSLRLGEHMVSHFLGFWWGFQMHVVHCLAFVGSNLQIPMIFPFNQPGSWGWRVSKDEVRPFRIFQPSALANTSLLLDFVFHDGAYKL